MLLVSSVLLLGEFMVEEELDFGDPRRFWKLRFNFKVLVENHLKEVEEGFSC